MPPPPPRHQQRRRRAFRRSLRRHLKVSPPPPARLDDAGRLRFGSFHAAAERLRFRQLLQVRREEGAPGRKPRYFQAPRWRMLPIYYRGAAALKSPVYQHSARVIFAAARRAKQKVISASLPRLPRFRWAIFEMRKKLYGPTMP